MFWGYVLQGTMFKTRSKIMSSSGGVHIIMAALQYECVFWPISPPQAQQGMTDNLKIASIL